MDCLNFRKYMLHYKLKKRSKATVKKSDGIWLDEVVYGEAIAQILETISAIKENNIIVNDLYHQKVQINKDFLIFPIVIFDNDNINDYKKVLKVNDTVINVFSLTDYNAMMEIVAHPYDIIFYLQERSRWLNHGSLPNFIFGDNENSSIIAHIESERDFAEFFGLYIYDGDINKREDALKLLSIINNFRRNQSKKHPEYKTILKTLQRIEPKVATAFMERFQESWNNANLNQFDWHRAIRVDVDDKKTSIVFFSVGNSKLKDPSYYQLLGDAKLLQHKSDAVLIIAFVGNGKNECLIDWFYWEKTYVPDEKALLFYEKVGMYNGGVDKTIYEEMCSKFSVGK